MKILLWFYLLLHAVYGDRELSSYLGSSRICRQWSCINSNLGLQDSLPSRDQYTAILKSLLPPGAWQDVVGPALDVCFGSRPRIYTNTCPGQSLLHCVVDQFIQKCPEESLRKDDACAPLSSLAGFKYMFSQSRYENLEKNLPTEHRPTWFLKNYFSSKCCNLPELFNVTALLECGFSTIIHYYTHEPRHATTFNRVQTTTLSTVDKVKVVEISDNSIQPTPDPNYASRLKVVDLNSIGITDNNEIDPLDCCDVSDFIQPSWRSQCDFHLSWSKEDRLGIANQSSVPTTVAPTTVKPRLTDVKIVPQSCEQETCVFRKLNIVSETGSVDVSAFSKLLDNLTNVHPAWTKARGRVATKCLTKPITEYTDNCEINKVLACTFDVMSENCPHAKKNHPCRHKTNLGNDVTCQINSSKYRPKNRRQFCGLPSLVSHEVLAGCGLNSLSHMEFVPEPVHNPTKFRWQSGLPMCKQLTEPTKCVLNKMEILNKYGFIDYFKMKDRIREFSTNNEHWAALTDVYLSAFTGMPMYRDQCSSPKKLLNVLDTMLMTCPLSKRKITHQCNRIFTEMANTIPPRTQQISKEKAEEMLKHFHDIFFSKLHRPPQSSQVTPKPSNSTLKVNKTPLNEFAFLDSNSAPPVRIIDVKQKKPMVKKPLILLPVYLRVPGRGIGSVSVMPYRDGFYRSAPFALHNRIAMAHNATVFTPRMP